MTESEARSKIKWRIEVAREIAGNGVDGKAFEDLEIAIQALKEIREYRELGTLEELQALKECFGHTTPKSRGKAIYDKAIDDFAKKLKKLYQAYDIDLCLQDNDHLNYTDSRIALESYIDEIAEQLKGGAE